MERPDPGPAIAAFWRWWSDNRALLEQEVGSRGHDATFVEPLSSAVAAIHPDLDWEFGKGVGAEHHLCLSSKGDPTLRVLAERWRASGPGDDAFFEFHCARQRTHLAPSDLVMEFGGQRFEFGALKFDVESDDTRQRFHLTAHHPIFADVDERTRGQLLFIALDNLLGEDAVETWVGAVDASEEPAGDETIGPITLQRLVEGVHDRWPERTWALFRGQHPDTGLPMVLAACASHKYLLEPLFDTLVRVHLPYEVAGDGMPEPEVRAALDAYDREAADRLGDAIRVLARETGNGARTLWIYLLAENGPERRTLEDLAGAYDGSRVQVSWDPGWRQLPV